MQVQHNIELTFASGVRALLRQDPDIIMVGEVRDLETAEIAVQAALTGHLCFLLHTNDALRLYAFNGIGLAALSYSLQRNRCDGAAFGAYFVPALQRKKQPTNKHGKNSPRLG